MITGGKLLVFPALGLALLALAWFWSAREIRLRATGNAVEGRVAGLVLERDVRNDLVTGITSDVVLQRADGGHVAARSVDGELLEITMTDPSGQRVTTTPPAELLQMLDDVTDGGADLVRRALLREERRGESPDRIVRIERTDTVDGWFGLPVVPTIMGVERGRPSLPQPPPSRAVVRTVFDQTDQAALDRNKGESLVSYSFALDGTEVTPSKRDFVLQSEPYATMFRPVFVYESDGRQVARLSHIGRHGGPTLALRLHLPCLVYVDPADPTEAFLMADPGPFDLRDPLGWFSRYCEGLFAQWGGTALVILAGLVCIATGLVVVSLVLRPPGPKITPE